MEIRALANHRHGDKPFDKRTYAYTRYASLESYTSWVRIRPREFLVAIRYRL